MTAVIASLAEFPWGEVGGATGVVGLLVVTVKSVRDWRSARAKGTAEAQAVAAGADRVEIDNAEKITDIAIDKLLGPLTKQVARLERQVERLTTDLAASSEEAAGYRREAADAQAELSRYRREAEHSAEELRRASLYIEHLIAALIAAQVQVPHVPATPPEGAPTRKSEL